MRILYKSTNQCQVLTFNVLTLLSISKIVLKWLKL